MRLEHRMNGLEHMYFSWWRLDATEYDKYTEWSQFVTDTGSDMTYPAFCNQIDEWSSNV